MKAIHCNWTKPKLISGKPYSVEDFELFSTILSALKWREKNGNIEMVTDKTGLKYYQSRGLTELWDEISDRLENIPDTINPSVFWAAGKLYALKDAQLPTALIDTDFIVWDRLAFDNLADVSVIHSEELYSDIYPDRDYFVMKQGYTFNPLFDWNTRPANTAFYLLKNKAVKDMYLREAFDFMENSAGDNPITYMVFAEQRLLPMCAKALGVEVKEISTLERLFCNGEQYFTHIWGMKEQMRQNPQLRRDFCLRCAHRIKTDFPDWVDVLKTVPELTEYF